MESVEDPKRRGRRIAAARNSVPDFQGQQGLEEFAEAIGKSQWTVRAYESGRIQPPSDVLVRIAELSGKTVEWLATGRGDQGNPTGTITIGDREITGAPEVLAEIVRELEGAQEPATAEAEPGIVALLEPDTQAALGIAITEEEARVLLNIRLGGQIKTVEKALLIWQALRS